MAFSHGLHTVCSGLQQCKAHSVVLPSIFGSQCVHPLPRPSALKIFGFILKDLGFLPFFHLHLPSHLQISEGSLHQGHHSGALVHRDHPKHMEVVSTFGEEDSNVTMKKALTYWELNESSVEVQLTHGLSVAYDKILNMTIFQHGKGF